MRSSLLVCFIATLACGCLGDLAPNHNGGGSSGSGGAGANGGAGGSGSGGIGGMMGVPQNCPNGGTTTITGKVLAPNGNLPLYNAIVYIPSTTPAPFTDGVTCDTCNGHVSGNPLVSTLSNPDGTFTLTNTTWGPNVPLVVQLGKWRKQSVIPMVTSCTGNQVDTKMTTLPSNHTQGDMPKMAIATGSADPFECLLLKIGIDPQEIQPTGQTNRIDFFVGANSPGTSMAGAQVATSLTTSLSTLMKYDIVMLPCEGDEFQQQGTDQIVQYVNMGGRLFTTHYSYDWLSYTGSPFNAISQPLTGGLWDKNQMDYPNDSATTQSQLVTSFPKGMAFQQWLVAAGVQSASQSRLDIKQIRHDIDGVDPNLAQAWATDSMPDGKAGIAHLTFNTPLSPPTGPDNAPMYCGRVVYSDFHVAQSEAQGPTFPSACQSGPLSDQEKALAFMLFDLSSCVQSDQSPPTPIQ